MIENLKLRSKFILNESLVLDATFPNRMLTTAEGSTARKCIPLERTNPIVCSTHCPSFPSGLLGYLVLLHTQLCTKSKSSRKETYLPKADITLLLYFTLSYLCLGDKNREAAPLKGEFVLHGNLE